MRPSFHLAASLPTAGMIQLYTGSWACASACLLAGVLIDVDHFFDLAVNHPPHRFLSFFQIMRDCDLRRIFLLAHSWELLALLWAVALSSHGCLLLGTAAGITVHMLCDQFTNPVHWWTYFLIPRIAVGFKKERVLRGF